MTSDSGTYALLLRADAKRDIEVGALGPMTVSPGTYVYVGSAFGPGGVQARVRRHARAEGASHWHVDFLRAVTVLERVWYTHDDIRRECSWTRVLHELPGAQLPYDGFGASDCECPSHLVRFEAAPSLEAFRTRVRAECSTHASIHEKEARALEGEH